MLEVDVNCLVDEIDPFDLSHSQLEGGPLAGPRTWQAAKDAAQEVTLQGFDADSAKAFFAEFGAWEREEIAAWSDDETRALVLQYAAGDLRELQSLAPGDGVGGIDWREAEKLSEEGTCGGNLFVYDGRLFISLSS